MRCWSCEDVALWLKRNGFGEYGWKFSTEHKIDGVALLTLNESDLRSPLLIETLGDLKRLWFAISELQRTESRSLGLRNGSTHRRSLDHVDGPRHTSEILSDEDSDEEDSGFAGQLSHLSDFGRTLVSVAYAAMVFFLTSFVMALVHDRVPDMKKYPPLPDIVLDNIPLIPWAFTMCEISAMILSVVLAVVVFLHKYRLIVLRRIFALAGTVFLLRCLTMFVTSLSVPGIHLECSGKVRRFTVYSFIYFSSLVPGDCEARQGSDSLFASGLHCTKNPHQEILIALHQEVNVEFLRAFNYFLFVTW